MRDKFLEMTPQLYEYMVEQGSRQDELLGAIERETAELGAIAQMQIAPEEGALLTLLAGALGARRAVEVGTFTGYSAICIARGLAEGGSLLCCEISEEWAAVARENVRRADLDNRIEVRVAPALETLQGLPAGEEIDFAFVDADKPAYRSYYDELLPHLRPGALMALDNVLLGGRVIAPDQADESSLAMRELNAHVAGDPRVDCAMIGVADGLTLVRKR